MSIHEHLPPQARRDLKKLGWAKGIELAKLARRDRQRFDCATWLHKARQMPTEEFKQEVERELTGKHLHRNTRGVKTRVVAVGFVAVTSTTL